jgi:hypothetical protein
MLLHPLALDVRCPYCGAGLTFLRVRRYGDLYQCSDGPCRREVLHYWNKGTKACGYALAYGSGVFGAWTACGAKPAAAASGASVRAAAVVGVRKQVKVKAKAKARGEVSG